MLLGFGESGAGVKIRFGLKMRRAVDCIVEGSFRAARLGVRRCFRSGGSGVGVKIGFGLKMRRSVDCVVGGSFRASRLGVRRCF